MIQISHLTVQSFDPYDGTYNYLVEVFDKSPEDQDANLLATGVCSKKTLFDKKIIYPKGESDQVYIIGKTKCERYKKRNAIIRV